MPPLLSIQNLSKSFGSVLVTDCVNLDITQGQSVGIIGPNGAGKSTLFNLITGNIAPDTGTVLLNGRDISLFSCAKRCKLGIARSFQIPQPFGDMSVFDNALVAATHGSGLASKSAEAACIDALQKTGLLAKANVTAGSLTLLERKRLELTRSLASQPSLLLLDEIAGGLTDKECQSLIQTIKDIMEQGVTIIWIEHIVHALLAVVDRLIVLDFGKIIADGNPTQTMASSQVKEIYMGIDAGA